MAERGRPKKGDVRDHIFEIRANDEEVKEFLYTAEKMGLSVSEMVRNLVNSKYRYFKWYD